MDRNTVDNETLPIFTTATVSTITATTAAAPAPLPYVPPWWLSNAHTQTVYPPLFAKRAAIQYKRERWGSTPHGKADGDFVDVDRLAAPQAEDPRQPMLVVFHGLEGSSQSVYALNLMHQAQQRGWRGMVPHFRGCSGEMNRLPRAYHSGDAAEIDWILRRVKAESPDAPLYVAAISLGGNATLKWLGEQGGEATKIVTAVAAISAPVDLTAAGNALEVGLSKIYAKNFLASMKKNALEKLAYHPGIFNADVVRAAATLREFDNEVTAPLHGYRNTDDYWLRASAKPGLIDVRVPTLLLNAQNDPFLPAWALPTVQQVSSSVTLDFPSDGGHVGFFSSSSLIPFFGDSTWMPKRVLHFFDHQH